MGGHGGLNILPQKSWNVYGRKQRERVRRDEEQLEREQREEAARKEEEEKEKRLRALRGEKEEEEEEEEKESGQEGRVENGHENKHVNFFEEHEKALASLERKQKAKKSEEDEGNRLGGSGTHLRQPWYAKSDASFYDDEDDDDDDDGGKKHRSLPKRIRMQREETERLRLADKEQPFENRPTLTKVMLRDGYVPPSERRRREKREKKKKKDKKKKKRRRSSSSSSFSSSDDETKEDEQTRALKIQKMREERARREMKERERAKSVFTNATKNPFA